MTETATVAGMMRAVDGSFDQPVEWATAVLATSGLAPDRHLIYVRGRDAAGN